MSGWDNAEQVCGWRVAKLQDPDENECELRTKDCRQHFVVQGDKGTTVPFDCGRWATILVLHCPLLFPAATGLVVPFWLQERDWQAFLRIHSSFFIITL